MLRDGVYLEWLPGSEPEELPAAIALVDGKSISFHANTFDDRIVRFPLRNTFAQIRGALTGIGERAEFVSEGRRKLAEYLQSESVTSHRIQHVAWNSPESTIWKAVAESWWDDFDTPIPVVGPRLMAGVRLVGPNNWHVAVGLRVNYRHSYMSHPSVQFRVKAASLDEVRREITRLRNSLIRDMHQLIPVLEGESDSRS